MQKVVGSSPIIRLALPKEKAAKAAFLLPADHLRRHAHGTFRFQHRRLPVSGFVGMPRFCAFWMTLLSAVYRLNGPELRLRFKPAKKDEVGVFSFAGDDVFPLIGQA